MSRQKFDGVIEAARYTPEGEIDVLRAYERRGSAFSDHKILSRKELLERLQQGRNFVIGNRVSALGGTFEIHMPVILVKQSDGSLQVSTRRDAQGDELENVPLF